LKLRVLTFNTWGVPFFSRQRAARIRAIGRALSRLNADVIGLQEAFFARDRAVIAKGAAEAGLVYNHYFASGVMGSGLFTLSRYPIVETSFLRFQLNGRPQDLIRSDYYAGKGVGRVRVQTPVGPFDVYNAHFIAPYLEFGPDRFSSHRVAQALEASRYIRTQSGPVPSVLTCDLNCFPDDLTYRTIVSGSLVETYSEANLASDAVTVTDRSGYATIHPPARFDYIFARSASCGTLKVTGSRIVMDGIPNPNPEGLVGYSDHYGVLTEFDLAPPSVEMLEPVLADTSLASSISNMLDAGARQNGMHRRKARLVAVAAGAASAALIRSGSPRPGGAVGRVLASAALAALLVTGGVNLSTAARLNTESNTLNTFLGEEF
jgi:endonuclease/exonuclease/phosphatase family metal-dependent hydrolase